MAADAASAVLLFRMSQAYTRRQARTQRHLHVIACVRCAERQRCAAAACWRCAGPKAPTGVGHDESVGVRAPIFVEPMRDCGMHWVRCGGACRTATESGSRLRNAGGAGARLRLALSWLVSAASTRACDAFAHAQCVCDRRSFGGCLGAPHCVCRTRSRMRIIHVALPRHLGAYTHTCLIVRHRKSVA
jgi:hypothetical protein